MAYRDDLEAALEHAAAAESELERAKSENAEDHRRIAELEQQLADAKRRLGDTEKRKPKPEKVKDDAPERRNWNGLIATLITLVMIGGGVALFVFISPNSSKLGRQLKSKSSVQLTSDLPGALAEAQKFFPDALLTRIEADYVDPRGVTDLAKYGGEVRYRFMSQSRADMPDPPPSGPIGAPQQALARPICAVAIVYRKGVMRTYDYQYKGSECGRPIREPLRCSIEVVWAEAIRRGAPKEALAHVRVDRPTKAENVNWSLRIVDQGKQVFDMDLPDACGL